MTIYAQGGDQDDDDTMERLNRNYRSSHVVVECPVAGQTGCSIIIIACMPLGVARGAVRLICCHTHKHTHTQGEDADDDDDRKTARCTHSAEIILVYHAGMHAARFMLDIIVVQRCAFYDDMTAITIYHITCRLFIPAPFGYFIKHTRKIFTSILTSVFAEINVRCVHKYIVV